MFCSDMVCSKDPNTICAHVNGPDLVQGMGTVPEFWGEYLKKGGFTEVTSENCMLALCPGTKCDHSLERRK